MKKILIMTNILLLAAVTAHAQERFNYAEQWHNIDKLMDGILPKSALPEIEKVREAALRDNEYGHLIRSVTTRSTCLQMTEENPFAAVINSLKNDAETFPFPIKAVIYSLIGETYLNYYNQNRWKIYDRTTVAEEVKSDDFETWDTARLLQ